MIKVSPELPVIHEPTRSYCSFGKELLHFGTDEAMSTFSIHIQTCRTCHEAQEDELTSMRKDADAQRRSER